MSLARNVATVGGITFLSRILGFGRDVMIAAVFGAGVRADAFFVAFQVANLIRRSLAEGAMNAAVVPLYLRARDQGGETAAGAYAGQLIGTLAIGLTGLAILLALAMPVLVTILAPGFVFGGPRMTIAVELARLMLPYLALAGPLAVLMGVLNANHRFAFAALATAAFNATMLAALGVIFLLQSGDSTLSGRIVAFSVAIAGLAQLVLVGIAVLIGPERVTPLGVSFGAPMRRFMALAIPGLVASGIPQITIIAAVMVASASPSAVSWLYYANRLVELPLGIVGMAIGTVLVPAFAHALRSGDRNELAVAESRGLEIALFLALPAAVALAVLAKPIVAVPIPARRLHRPRQRGDRGCDECAGDRPAGPCAGEGFFSDFLRPRRHRDADVCRAHRLRGGALRQHIVAARPGACRRGDRDRVFGLGRGRGAGHHHRAADRIFA